MGRERVSGSGRHGPGFRGTARNRGRAVGPRRDADHDQAAGTSARAGWLHEIGPRPILSWTYHSPVGRQTVRQVVYDGPLVVDIAIASWIQAALTGATVASMARVPRLRRAIPPSMSAQLDAWLQITRRGIRVLVDKDGIATRMARSIGETSTSLPSEAEFLNTVHSLFGLLFVAVEATRSQRVVDGTRDGGSTGPGPVVGHVAVARGWDRTGREGHVVRRSPYRAMARSAAQRLFAEDLVWLRREPIMGGSRRDTGSVQRCGA